ncbi:MULTISPECIES: methyltransferase [unclassified Streptomyces]|uniref:methyltransferase n=1 Tax=unclassified Streptomyces TaxID=2593676 RepID=UPI002E318985|nr:methyltransferase [Streptomyces sp. NBC_01268]
MAQELSAAERIALRGLLGAVAKEPVGHLSSEWEEAAWAVPRHRFLPERIYLGDDLEPCDRTETPETWLQAAYADAPVVTQVNDGHDPGDADRWPSSSASEPSIVFRMLDMLDLADGHRVLEIGTGTGWNAGLLAHRLGGENVTTVEWDPALADAGAACLRRLGLGPAVITGDGALGHPSGGPYDRVEATCSVRSVPRAWVEQTKPGGIILVPWESPWFCYGLLRLEAGAHGDASGVFAPHSAFMLMRHQRTDLRIFRDVVRDGHRPEESWTVLPPQAVAGRDWSAQFALGLRLRDVWRTWQDDPGVDGVASRLWVATTDARSWAAVDRDGRSEDRFTVWQYGPRRLWNEVEAAYAWWFRQGRPGPGRYGLTTTPEGERVWLDHPDRPLPGPTAG